MIEKIDRALGQMVRENDSIALAAEVAQLRAENRTLRESVQTLRNGTRAIVGEAQVEKNLLYAEVARLRDALLRHAESWELEGFERNAKIARDTVAGEVP